jgi:ABC-type polysaccharide transport system permease subunit
MEIFAESSTMIETQFFMLKYGVFIVASILGTIGTLGTKTKYNTVTMFVKHLVMTMVLSVAVGILISNFWDFSLEVNFAIVVVIAFFIQKVIEEVNEILSNASDVVSTVVRKKLKITEKEKTEE